MRPTSKFFLPAMLLLMLLLAACGGAAPTSAPEDEVILTLFGTNGPEYLTMTQLKALPSTEGMGGIVSSTGEITIPELYKGVALKDLVTAFGGTLDSSMGVTLTATDGYSMTYSYAQVMEGDFIAYDPALGNELVEHDPLTAILAYERNGEPLDPVQDGILRLVVISQTNNQVTDGHWSVKWINKVEVDTVGSTWTLVLDGAMLSQVDRGSYQSCSSPGCHGVEWQDENGQTWEGVPLWLLVGEVDDADGHSDYAFNETLAATGYTIDVVAADGYTVTFDSVSIKMNGNIIVAYLVNGSELPEQHYPLRLVGSDLESGEMVSQIARIVVHVPAAATLTPASSGEVSGDFVITGLVDQPLGLTDADLHASEEVVTISAEHPKNGLQEFTGIRLECLLNWAGVDPTATTVTLTASDGYSGDISLSDLLACEDCMLAFTDEPGVYNAVMPGLASSLWIKEVSSIEVK